MQAGRTPGWQAEVKTEPTEQFFQVLVLRYEEH